jgi:hypothetical protein
MNVQKASKDYNLQLINPGLAKEWHPTKNGSLTPANVTPGSNMVKGDVGSKTICERGVPSVRQ